MMYWLIWLFGFVLISALFIYILLQLQPKYFVIALNRILLLKNGFARKEVKISPSLSLFYVERGSKSLHYPSLILVHGFSGSKENFLRLFPYIPQNMHVVAVDLQGHGESGCKENEDFSMRSYVKHIKELVDILGLGKRKFHIAGCSMGGHIAGMYSIMYPDDVLSASLFCPHGIKNKCEEAYVDKALKENKLLLIPETLDQYEELRRTVFHQKINIPEWFLKGAFQLRVERQEINRKVALALREEENLYLLEKSLEKLTKPVLLVWGKEDKILDVACVDVIKSKLPEPPTVHLLENCGHTFIVENPRKAATLLSEFVDKIESNNKKQ